MRYEWLIPAALLGVALPVELAYSTDYVSAEGARKAAFPDATAFEPVVVTADIKAQIGSEAGRFNVDPRIWRVLAGERYIGWFMIDEVIGKQELITYSLALDTTGQVRALDVLTYRESHGDGIRLPAWRAQFTGKRVTDPVRLDADIRNISGATLSCRHVTEGVHRLLLVYRRALANG